MKTYGFGRFPEWKLLVVLIVDMTGREKAVNEIVAHNAMQNSLHLNKIILFRYNQLFDREKILLKMFFFNKLTL